MPSATHAARRAAAARYRSSPVRGSGSGSSTRIGVGAVPGERVRPAPPGRPRRRAGPITLPGPPGSCRTGVRRTGRTGAWPLTTTPRPVAAYPRGVADDEDRGTPVPDRYADRWIRCTDAGIEVRGYYLPWAPRPTSPTQGWPGCEASSTCRPPGAGDVSGARPTRATGPASIPAGRGSGRRSCSTGGQGAPVPHAGRSRRLRGGRPAPLRPGTGRRTAERARGPLI